MVSVSPVHQLARSLRQEQTVAEKHLWARLRGNELAGFTFRRQFPIGEFIADFCCTKSKLVIELDGAQHGDDAGQVAEDNRRTALLSARGYRVVRFWNEEVFANLEGVLERILAELRNPHLTSP
jgi:very-short-patch-repair endonuclease